MLADPFGLRWHLFYLAISQTIPHPLIPLCSVCVVTVHPVIQVPNQLVGAPLGTDVQIECHVEASPKSINYWIKDTGKCVSRPVCSRYIYIYIYLSVYIWDMPYAIYMHLCRCRAIWGRAHHYSDIDSIRIEPARLALSLVSCQIVARSRPLVPGAALPHLHLPAIPSKISNPPRSTLCPS